MKCGSGFVYGIKRNQQNVPLAQDKTSKLHGLFCHSDLQQVKRTAKDFGCDTSEIEETIDCEDCNVGKAKVKAVPKIDQNRSKTPGERLLINISSLKTTEAKKKFWVLVENRATKMKWSFFVNKKDEQVNPIVNLIKAIQSDGKKVKHIRCDNAGGNKLLQQARKEKGDFIKFEYTVRNTPQQNGQVERSFATLYGRMRLMMRAGNMTEKEKQTFWIEAASTAKKVDNLLIRKGETKGQYQAIYGSRPDYEQHLRTFWEKGIVTKKMGNEVKAKIEDRGLVYTFLGYAKDHTGDTYSMRNNKTGEAIIARDVVWTEGKAPKVEEDNGIVDIELEMEDKEKFQDESDKPKGTVKIPVKDVTPKARGKEWSENYRVWKISILQDLQNKRVISVS